MFSLNRAHAWASCGMVFARRLVAVCAVFGLAACVDDHSEGRNLTVQIRNAQALFEDQSALLSEPGRVFLEDFIETYLCRSYTVVRWDQTAFNDPLLDQRRNQLRSWTDALARQTLLSDHVFTRFGDPRALVYNFDGDQPLALIARQCRRGAVLPQGILPFVLRPINSGLIYVDLKITGASSTN